MQDLQITVRMETLALERRTLPPGPSGWQTFLLAFRLPGYHHTGREGVGPSASWSSNAGQPLALLRGLRVLCKLSSPAEAGPHSFPPTEQIHMQTFLPCPSGQIAAGVWEGDLALGEMSPSAWPDGKGAARGESSSREMVKASSPQHCRYS